MATVHRLTQPGAPITASELVRSTSTAAAI
jgi:hypothetical protein